MSGARTQPARAEECVSDGGGGKPPLWLFLPDRKIGEREGLRILRAGAAGNDDELADERGFGVAGPLGARHVPGT